MKTVYRLQIVLSFVFIFPLQKHGDLTKTLILLAFKYRLFVSYIHRLCLVKHATKVSFKLKMQNLDDKKRKYQNIAALKTNSSSIKSIKDDAHHLQHFP